jgi:hypothetical protein
VTSDGVVNAAFNEIIKVHCQYDIAMFPFDTQNCTIALGPWQHTLVVMGVVPDSEEASSLDIYEVRFEGGLRGVLWGLRGFIVVLQENTEWDIVSYNATGFVLDYEEYAYSEVHWYLVIKRKPQYYIQVGRCCISLFIYYLLQVLALPTFIITTLSIFGVFSPFSSEGVREEKVNNKINLN